MKDYYDELEVSHTASQEIINKAYKILAKRYHPDTTKLEKEVAEEKFKKISEAYEILSDEQKRREYDENLKVTNPQISIEDYNKVLHDNQILSNEVTDLKNQINTFNNRQTNNTTYSNNINYVPNKQINYNSDYKTNRNNTSNSYSFTDLIKFKIKNFLKSVFAIFLTIALIYIIFQILLHIPYTKNFLLNDLGFVYLLDIFK